MDNEGKTIIHVDMDAFFAAVEVRDNPELAGKPLIIGALPHERGVVSTCSYEARKFGVRSAMSIKEAYRRCPHGIYRHPDMAKYKEASARIHDIWGDYTDAVEYISLDEGYLDVTGTLHMHESALAIAREIKARTRAEVGLTCSVGIGYCMTAAKLASEEKKPDGLFAIPDREAFVALIIDRNVRILYGVGGKTAEKLEAAGIVTVRDVQRHRQRVADTLGKHGAQIVQLADGIDNRMVVPWYEAEAKSIGREHTFQTDITDYDHLRDTLTLIARKLSTTLRFAGLYARTITLKVTYADMRAVTRSKSGDATNRADSIYKTAAALLDNIEKRPIRLVGISLDHLGEGEERQLSFADLGKQEEEKRRAELDGKLLALQKKYGAGIVKNGNELAAEKRLADEVEKEEEQ